MLKNILYNILALQEKFLRYKLSKTIGVKNTSKKKKHSLNGCTVDLNTLAEVEKQRIEDELTLILKQNDYDTTKILNYIKSQGTQVYYLENAAKILNPIGENEGFIYPAKGSKALYLSLGILKRFSLKTSEMFVIPKAKSVNKYYFIYHFYNWYAYKHGISGLDTESQDLLKKFLFENSNINTLQLADIYKLKDAITQDKAAIEFVFKLCRNYEGTKQALNKIKENGSAKL